MPSGLLENPYFFGFQDDQIPDYIVRFKREDIRLKQDPITKLMVAHLPKYKLFADGHNNADALSNLFKQYVQYKVLHPASSGDG